jgi:hypothetical protein
MLTRQQFGLKESHQVLQNFFGLQHAAVTRFAAGLFALADIQHMRAIRCELRHVALGGGVLPHFAVHRRRKNQGHAVHGTGQAHQTEQIVRATMQQFGHEVGTGWRDKNRIGLTA